MAWRAHEISNQLSVNAKSRTFSGVQYFLVFRARLLARLIILRGMLASLPVLGRLRCPYMPTSALGLARLMAQDLDMCGPSADSKALWSSIRACGTSCHAPADVGVLL